MDDSLATIAQEITMLRKLAVFALLNSGVSQDKVAGALGVSQATVSRLSGGGAKGNERAKVKVKKKTKR